MASAWQTLNQKHAGKNILENVFSKLAVTVIWGYQEKEIKGMLVVLEEICNAATLYPFSSHVDCLPVFKFKNNSKNNKIKTFLNLAYGNYFLFYCRCDLSP